MKKKDLKDLQDQSVDGLKKLIEEKTRESVKLRGENAIGRHKNIRMAKSVRRDVAQMKTILAQIPEEGKEK